jgi:hypothetical protein
MVFDANEKFLAESFEKAKATKAARTKDFQNNFGSQNSQHLNPKQEQTMWVGLIDHQTEQ